MKPNFRGLLAFLILFPTLAAGQELPSVFNTTNTLSVKVTNHAQALGPSLFRVKLFREGIPWDEAVGSASGLHTFTDLPEGRYTIVVSLPGYVGQTQTVELRGGETREVAVDFLSASDHSGSIRLPNDDRATVSLRELAVPAKARKQFDKAYQRYRRQDLHGAIKHQLRGLKIDSTFASAHNQLGFYYLRLGELGKAKQSLETALQFDRTLLGAYLNLADALAQEKEFKRAGQALIEASKVHPHRGEPYYVAAKIQFDTGHLDRAEHTCRLALERDHSQNPEVHLLLVNIYRRRGEKDKIAQHLEAYLTEAPTGEFAQQARATLEKLR